MKVSSKARTRIIVSSIAAGAVAAVLGVGAIVGAEARAKHPAVSEKVQQYYEASSTLKPVPTSTVPGIAFLGDSFTAGSNDTPGEPKSSYVEQAAGSWGWYFNNFAMGGTGYINPGSSDRTPFIGQVDRLVAVDPEFVVVAGGINDAKYPPAEVKAAAVALYKDIRAELPKAKIVAVGPITPGGVAEYPTAVPVRDALKEAAASQGVAFIDPIAENWMPTKQGVTDSTKFHPNAAGQALLAGKLKAALAALGIPGK